MTKIFVVEDEVKILETTVEMIQELGHEVLGSASTIDAAYQGILSKKPDLVLLDVELGSATSFDLLQRFEQIDFQIIFITAHQKYALDAFKFSAVDFLLKPLSFKLLEAAIRKVEVSELNLQKGMIETLRYNLNTSQSEQKIILKTQDKIWILKLDEIIHCESDLSYTIFYTDKERIMVSKTMGYYDELLNTRGFFRVHKSHLVNLKHVKKIHKTDGGEAELSNGSKIPISQRKKEEFLSVIEFQGLH
ncbi:MAG: LytTR family DNA-binding domain-containing protein [Bacteroidota bacterium]